MCGIAGIVNFSDEQLNQSDCRQMLAVLGHRGPDDDGLFVDANAVLGHVRLSIIDVAQSHQPMSNEDGSVWITFNGEIYNYRELRQELMSQGHQFQTQGDTEVLVHLYEQHGEQMVQRLQGMFAFAIWDKPQRQLLLARDRMGIKPLYFCQEGNDFIFASEPKAILQHPLVDSRPNEEGIWQYLTYRSVPAPQTLFGGIMKLKPGHLAVVTPRGCRQECYWDIQLAPKRRCRQDRRSDGQLIDKAEALLLECVERRLISDVPLGAFLSGGVDSSLIVAMMSKITNSAVRTYSVGFRDFPDSELPHAKLVAQQFNTQHHELVLSEECFAENLEKLTWMRDSPLSERGDIPMYLLAEMARQDVKVLLSGEGSDELFGGYPKYAFDRFEPIVRITPKAVMSLATHLLPARMRRIEVALKSLAEPDAATRWAQWFSPFTPAEKRRLLSSLDGIANPTAQYVQSGNGCSSLDAMLYADCKLWLPDNLLERADRMTMAASVEGRVPFLDHEFVEFAFGLSGRAKVRGFSRKWLVKQIARRYLPACIVDRPKNGFAVPLAQWFRGKLRDMCYDRICDRNSLAGELLDRAELRKILDDHCSGRKDNFLKIWTLLGLSIWAELFLGASAKRSQAQVVCAG